MREEMNTDLNCGVPYHFNSSSLEKSISQYIPFVKFIAYRLRIRLPSHVPLEELINAGIIGLFDALNKFDSKRKVSFKSYAEFRIKGAMLDELRSWDWVPRSTRKMANHLEKTRHDLEIKKGGPVEDEEVAEELGLPMNKYHSLINEINGRSLIRLECLPRRVSRYPGDEDPGDIAIDDGKMNDPFSLVSLREVRSILVKNIEKLNAEEKSVIYLYYYNGLVLREIGKILGLSESRICQIHTKAISKLRTKIKDI